MTALPPGWGVRRPTLDDVPAILEVCQASDIAAVGEPDFTADEVRETLTAPNHDPARDSWLGLDTEGTVVAWAYLDNPIRGPRDNVDVYVHPDRGRPAQAHLLDLAIARVAERATEAGLDSLVLRAGAIPTEDFYLGILAEAGFVWIKRYARMRIDLTGPEQAPELPAGLTIRTARDDEADHRLFWRLIDENFRDLPDYRVTTFENFQERLAAATSVTWDEWFVAELDGEPVGVLESADHSHDNLEGWVHYLAVSRSVRGRGIGRLLLRTAFATYVAKGYQTAGLGVDLTNPTGAYPLYTAVGMRPAYEIDVLERSVEAA